MHRHRKLLAEKLLDLANFSIVGLIFAQFTADKIPSSGPIIAGIFISSIIYVVAYFLLR